MTMLNGILAFGAIAFSVPLVIHLLFRSRFTTVDWGAMYLLDSVVRINRRRLQLMNLLLLLLRCAIPILLAFCLARPVLTGFKTLPGDAPQTLVIAIDDSRSMSARDETGQTRIEQAKADLTNIVKRLSRRDEVILLAASQIDSPPATMGPQDALRKIRELKTDGGPLDLGQFVRAAGEASAKATHVNRKVLIVSDFASANLCNRSFETLERVQTVLAESKPSPVVSFLNYGVDSDSLSNVSVDSILVDSPAVIAGRPARYSARFRNASDRVAHDVRVVWSVDGKPLPARTMSIPPRSTATDRLTHATAEPGIHVVTAAVEFADALSSDNRRSIGVDVASEIHVLVADGRPSSRPLEGESDFLAIALSPFAFGGEDLPDAVSTRVVTMRQFAKAIDEKRPDIVVLANMKSPGDNASRISDFVLQGGALVVFDGDSVDVESYNQGWESESGKLMLSATLAETVGDDKETRDKPFTIGAVNPQFTPWALLESKDQQPLSEVEVYRYRKLTVADDAVEDGEALPPSVTLLSMVGGDPLVVAARRGRGQVVQFGLPCDAAWSTFPMRIVYLPMIQQLVLDLGGNRSQTTYDVGQRLAVGLHEFGEPDTDEDPDNKANQAEKTFTYTLTEPGGSETVIEPDAGSPNELVVASGKVPGVYRFRRTIENGQLEADADETIRVVEIPKSESQLRDAESGQLAAAAKAVGANIHSDVASWMSDDREQRFGREIWRWLLLGLLVGMIGELFLQQHAVRRAKRGEA